MRSQFDFGFSLFRFETAWSKEGDGGGENKIATPAVLSSMASRCPYCQFCAESNHRMEKHLRQSHAGECKPGAQFICDLCGRGFALKANLALHSKTHTEERPFSCDKCEKAFKARNTLREHVLRHHDKVLQFSCGLCLHEEGDNNKFATRHQLMKHWRGSHGGGSSGLVCDEA